jgi:allophanate hydrolase
MEPLLEAGDLLYRGPWVAERLAELAGFMQVRASDVLPVTRAIIEGGRRFGAVDLFRAEHRLAALRHQVAELFTRIDVLVLPTIPTTFTLAEVAAEPVERNLVLGRYTQFVNLLDLAAVAMPNGFTPDGRPASLSLIGPAFSEPTLLQLAAAMQGTAVPVETNTVELAVVGHHLRGEARNGDLVALGGVYVRTTRTQPTYRLFRLPIGPTGLPGLVRVAGGGTPIEVEIWRLPTAAVGELLRSVVAPLSIGHVSVVDSEPVLGFLCEAYASASGVDISGSGGWRAATRSQHQPEEERWSRSGR